MCHNDLLMVDFIKTKARISKLKEKLADLQIKEGEIKKLVDQVIPN